MEDLVRDGPVQHARGLWTAAFLGAALVTLFKLGSPRNLCKWERLMDAANVATTALLALECADEQIEFLHVLSYGWRVALLFVICLIPQLTVTLAAREAREVARRLQRLSQRGHGEGQVRIMLVVKLDSN